MDPDHGQGGRSLRRFVRARRCAGIPACLPREAIDDTIDVVEVASRPALDDRSRGIVVVFVVLVGGTDVLPAQVRVLVQHDYLSDRNGRLVAGRCPRAIGSWCGGSCRKEIRGQQSKDALAAAGVHDDDVSAIAAATAVLRQFLPEKMNGQYGFFDLVEERRFVENAPPLGLAPVSRCEGPQNRCHPGHQFRGGGVQAERNGVAIVAFVIVVPVAALALRGNGCFEPSNGFPCLLPRVGCRSGCVCGNRFVPIGRARSGPGGRPHS
mmetsp:Transcript_10879/g.23047  ORF Transcript_10879/g.23047 Transcript_10879/m.23047 type:complete len:266 (-) Transcript_10879:259-1056(-)